MPKTTLQLVDILRWADAHRARTGKWPILSSGPIPDAPGEKWANIDQALRKGLRGCAGGSSLAQLLSAHRGKRNRKRLPPLTQAQILRWIRAHHRRTGTWPRGDSGPIPGSNGETWGAVEVALNHGQRGLPGGSTLPQLLAEHFGVRNIGQLPRLTDRKIRAWARRHRRRTGGWPTVDAGPVADAPGETWLGVDVALKQGHRGLPGGSSLFRLLKPLRGAHPRGNTGRPGRSHRR
jgi:hypothetical protein